MKNVGKWIGIVIGFFVALVGITFAVLSFLEPEDENVQMAFVLENKSVASQLLNNKQVEIDSLLETVGKLKNELFFSNLSIDSLGEALEFDKKIISIYEDTIGRLNNDLLVRNKGKIRIKELAKTYETMKTEEMRPILENVDDDTVIAIYENMSSRSRKTIMKALSGERAAKITIRLAGVNSG